MFFQWIETSQATTRAWNDTVQSIMAHRTRAMQQWWQQAPAHLQQCATNPLHMATWYGQTLQAAIDLGCDTTAARAHLLKTWQKQSVGENPTQTHQPNNLQPTACSLPPTVLGQPHFGSPQMKGTFVPAASLKPTPATTKVMAALLKSSLATSVQPTHQQPPTSNHHQRAPLPRIFVPELTRTASVTKVTKATNTLRQPLEQAVHQPSHMEAQQPHEARNIVPFPAPSASSTSTSFARNASNAASINARRGVGSRLTRGRAR